MTNARLIGVTGATGEVGARVAQRLAGHGAELRLIVRDAGRAPRISGAAPAEITGYGDGESVRRATEEHIRASGVPFTFLRMNMYMDFVPSMTGADGVIRGPAGDGRAGFVLRDDLADVAAAVLVDPAPHEGNAYDVTGPEALSFGDVARIMGVSFHDETIDEAWRSRRATGAADWEIEGWVSSYTAVARGELDVVSDTVSRLAGHDPISLEQYVSASGAAPTSP